MLKVSTLLGLMLISLTAIAGNLPSESKSEYAQSMRKLNEQIDSDKAASGANPIEYYTEKLSDCISKGRFEFKISQVLDKKTPQPFSFKSCSGIISQALARQDLSENQIKNIIDHLAEEERAAEALRAQHAARDRNLNAQTEQIIQYGDQKLKSAVGQ